MSLELSQEGPLSLLDECESLLKEIQHHVELAKEGSVNHLHHVFVDLKHCKQKINELEYVMNSEEITDENYKKALQEFKELIMVLNNLSHFDSEYWKKNVNLESFSESSIKLYEKFPLFKTQFINGLHTVRYTMEKANMGSADHAACIEDFIFLTEMNKRLLKKSVEQHKYGELSNSESVKYTLQEYDSLIEDLKHFQQSKETIHG